MSLPQDQRPTMGLGDGPPELNLEEGTDMYNQHLKVEHTQLFPFRGIIQTLFFVIQSDLSSEQLRVLLQRSVYENRTIKTWDMDFLNRVFRDLIAEPNVSLENPTYNRGQRTSTNRSFLVLEDGWFVEDTHPEPQWHSGLMVEDMESGDVGFIDDRHDWGDDNEFWTLDDNGVFFTRKYRRRSASTRKRSRKIER